MDPQLKSQRMALEALATTLESMEEDTKIAIKEFEKGKQVTEEWLTNIETSSIQQQHDGRKVFQVILASSSKWRRSLIKQILPIGFELCTNSLSPDIDEKAIRRDDPYEMVKAIAHAKADKALKMIAHSKMEVDFIICADQVIVYGDVVREKPLSPEQCKEHLQSYGLNQIPAKCLTGVVIVCTKDETRFEGTDESLQYFKKVPDKIAQALIAKGDIMYCAGSFVVEDPLLTPYLGERIGEIESVQGMPKSLTIKLLLNARRHLMEKYKKNF